MIACSDLFPLPVKVDTVGPTAPIIRALLGARSLRRERQRPDVIAEWKLYYAVITRARARAR